MESISKRVTVLEDNSQANSNNPKAWDAAQSVLSGLGQFLASESFLKMMEKASYFTFEALFVPKILKFCLDFLVMQKNSLIRNIRLISRFMTSQPGKQTVAIHLLPNISRSKDNQLTKLGQLIECNIRNISLKIS